MFLTAMPKLINVVNYYFCNTIEIFLDSLACMEPLIDFMESDLAIEIVHRGVANLASSLTYWQDMRFASSAYFWCAKRIAPQYHCARINRRFLNKNQLNKGLQRE